MIAFGCASAGCRGPGCGHRAGAGPDQQLQHCPRHCWEPVHRLAGGYHWQLQRSVRRYVRALRQLVPAVAGLRQGPASELGSVAATWGAAATRQAYVS